MAPLEHTILYTVMPRGIHLGGGKLPVSVLVSPRLMGGSKLGEFPDWLNWTAWLKKNGLKLTLTSGAHQVTLPIDTELLRPELWQAIFKKDTLVRSYEYPDYASRPVLSYPVRTALSLIKSIYQVAGATLQGGADQEKRGLRTLLDGLQVGWDDRRASEMRKQYAYYPDHDPASRGPASRAPSGMLGSDGLLPTYLLAQPGSQAYRDLQNRTAEQFATFQNMPSAPPIETPDWDNLLDFHQALSALNAYRELQRALGLVFDLDLPEDFPLPSGPLGPESLAVTDVKAGWRWRIPPRPVYPLSTAYLYFDLGGGASLFMTAPNLTPSNRSGMQAIGLLNLAPGRFGLAQVDVDGGMNKAIQLAESIDTAAPSTNPEIYDLNQALPALRSGGFSLFADQRALSLLGTLQESTDYNQALVAGTPQPRPFYTEDLVRGYRLDMWDSHSDSWHSLHFVDGVYELEDQTLATSAEEGFVQLAATQAAPDPARTIPADELYLHEAIARWSGWSLSAPTPGKHLTRHADPDKAVPPDPTDPQYDPENVPATPFKMTTHYKVVKGTLPRLRFGTRYRLRARVVDLAGNSLAVDDLLADGLAASLALPQDPEGIPYLRYEPVGSPVVVLRDEQAVQLPGSALERIVIRTWNADPSHDGDPADLLANDRHIAPPRTHVEMAERLGMFDDASGKLIGDPAMWDLIRQRDEGQFNQTPTPVVVSGQKQTFPLEPAARIAALPYLPDPLARGAALRDLPGSSAGTRAAVAPDGGAAAAVDYTPLSDPNPRPGSALLVGYGGDTWQKTGTFRLALVDGDGAPNWDPAAALLTVALPKGTMKTVPLSSYLSPADLKLMGVWQWLREYINLVTIFGAQPQYLVPGMDVDRIAHVLQWSVEGGHWMLTPPRLLTLVHAVQQPLGRPAFTALTVQRQPEYGKKPLKTQPETYPTQQTELNPLTGWREPGSGDAYLLGGLYIHGASSSQVELRGTWTDPVDDLTQPAPSETQFDALVDTLPLGELDNATIWAGGKENRYLAYYDAHHDLLAFVRPGDRLGSLAEGQSFSLLMAPRHRFNDTKHHVVHYTALATSRYREYFPQDIDPPLDFTRSSEPTPVDIPASARPAAPRPLYVLPTFDWQRETSTNIKRSVRFGGGMRIYLERPWFSSGIGELLGVALWDSANGAFDRHSWKPFITQWGQDPIWESTGVSQAPGAWNFAGVAASEGSLSLDEPTPPNAKSQPGTVDVVGFPVAFDPERGLWYCDLTLNPSAPVYNPFVRLALVRYQPNALPDAKLSRVVLADFVQLTPERSAVVTGDPYHPRQLRVTISGPAPTGPQSSLRIGRFLLDTGKPTQIVVHVQQRDPVFPGDLVWQDVPASMATVHVDYDAGLPAQPELSLWTGTVEFAQTPEPGQFRLLVEETEYIGANYVSRFESRGSRLIRRVRPGRLIYAETIMVDSALVG